MPKHPDLPGDPVFDPELHHRMLVLLVAVIVLLCLGLAGLLSQ